MISEREGVIFSLCIMENFVNAFDHEFDSMKEGVGLFAEAMAHLIDRERTDYFELLAEDVAPERAAADEANSYE